MDRGEEDPARSETAPLTALAAAFAWSLTAATAGASELAPFETTPFTVFEAPLTACVRTSFACATTSLVLFDAASAAAEIVSDTCSAEGIDSWTRCTEGVAFSLAEIPATLFCLASRFLADLDRGAFEELEGAGAEITLVVRTDLDTKQHRLTSLRLPLRILQYQHRLSTRHRTCFS